MAEETHGPTQHHQPDKADGPKLKGKNTKWYLIGGLGIVALLVFVFVRQSNANAGNSASAAGPSGGLDPSTEAALQSALSAQASGAFSGGGAVQGPPGPAGPQGAAGAAGAKGATGATGARGATGATGPRGTAGKTTTVAPKAAPKPAPAPKHTGKTYYTVKPGDNLSVIASRFHLPNWQSLYNANRSVVGGNPNLIHPGQRLLIP